MKPFESFEQFTATRFVDEIKSSPSIHLQLPLSLSTTPLTQELKDESDAIITKVARSVYLKTFKHISFAQHLAETASKPVILDTVIRTLYYGPRPWTHLKSASELEVFLRAGIVSGEITEEMIIKLIVKHGEKLTDIWNAWVARPLGTQLSLPASNAASSTPAHRKTSSPRKTRSFTKFVDSSLKSQRISKSTSDNILTRTRDANVPGLHHRRKKLNTTTAFRKHFLQDGDHEELRIPSKKENSREGVTDSPRRIHHRKANLAEDSLLGAVASRIYPKKVGVPCQRYIQLDARGQYYDSIWFKHPGVKHYGALYQRSQLSLGSDFCLGNGMDLEAEHSESSTVDRVATIDFSPLINPVVSAMDDEIAIRILADMYLKARNSIAA